VKNIAELIVATPMAEPREEVQQHNARHVKVGPSRSLGVQFLCVEAMRIPRIIEAEAQKEIALAMDCLSTGDVEERVPVRTVRQNGDNEGIEQLPLVVEIDFRVVPDILIRLGHVPREGETTIPVVTPVGTDHGTKVLVGDSNGNWRSSKVKKRRDTGLKT
jgi:hypothetical protein